MKAMCEGMEGEALMRALKFVMWRVGGADGGRAWVRGVRKTRRVGMRRMLLVGWVERERGRDETVRMS